MHKKEPLRKISLWLPIRWLAMLDDKARQQCISRTQIIKNIIVAKCLK